MKANHVKLGVQFAGVCPLCGKYTGDASYMKQRTSLYVIPGQSPKYLAVHPECAGGTTKVSNKVKYRKEPADVIEVDNG